MEIGKYEWQVLLVDRKAIDGSDGRTIPNEFKILIASDLNYNARLLCFIHELIHSFLATNGRCYTKNINIEDMCEFVSWNYEEIEECVNEFRKKYDS